MQRVLEFNAQASLTHYNNIYLNIYIVYCSFL